MQEWLFTRRGRLRVVEYHDSSPPSVGGVLYSFSELGPGKTLAQARALSRPWVCLGLFSGQSWTRRARVAVEQWLRKGGG